MVVLPSTSQLAPSAFLNAPENAAPVTGLPGALTSYARITKVSEEYVMVSSRPAALAENPFLGTFIHPFGVQEI